MGTHLLVNCVDRIEHHYNSRDAAGEAANATIELLDATLIEKKPYNVTEKNNKILWAMRESDGSFTNNETHFIDGFYTLEDIQIALNNDLKLKGCPIQFLIKYDNYFLNKITIFKIIPPNCRRDVFLMGESLLESMGFSLNNWLQDFPVSNSHSITLFPYAKYELHVDIIDSQKNLLNGEPSYLMCYLTYPFNIKPIKKQTNKDYHNIKFDVYESARKINANYFQFSFILNGE